MNNQTKNFLQSTEWREFQQETGKKTFFMESDGFLASIISHRLPLVGGYFYVPKEPAIEVKSQKSKVKSFLNDLIDLAKKENVGWVRIDPENEELLNLIKKISEYKIVKAPHDMQPKETFVIDIAKSEEILLAEMKSKTRYNVKLSQKQGVCVKVISNDKCQMTNQDQMSNDKTYYINEFLRLTKEMAKRNGITSHPEEYYRKMIESLPNEMLKLYAAEYENKIIAANLVLFYGDTATYLHGASGNEHRNVMAPFLLQWQAILDARNAGYKYYDFGGVKTVTSNQQPVTSKNDWQGITNFKLGFSPNTPPLEFPGSYDIVIVPFRYWLYRIIQKVKSYVR